MKERFLSPSVKNIFLRLEGNNRFVIYAFGLPWLMINLSASLSDTLLWGLWPFIPGDALKLVLASLALPGAWAIVDRVKK